MDKRDNRKRKRKKEKKLCISNHPKNIYIKEKQTDLYQFLLSATV